MEKFTYNPDRYVPTDISANELIVSAMARYGVVKDF